MTITPTIALPKINTGQFRFGRRRLGQPLPNHALTIEGWPRFMFPDTFDGPHGYASHHLDFWRWIDAIRPGYSPDPLVYCVGRGEGKSTSLEAAAVKLGARYGKRNPGAGRKFLLLIRATQQKANEAVRNIQSLLASPNIERYYPGLASPALTKEGRQKAYRMNLLRCANGYGILGVGLDGDVRGAKLEEYRPDVIALDDIDEDKQSYEVIQKNEKTITDAIIGAAADNVAFLVTQNLLRAGGIMSRLVDTGPNGARYLIDRKVIGPVPSIRGLQTEPQIDGDGRQRDIIAEGTPTWEGRPIEIYQKKINDQGLATFLKECQHEVVKTESRLVYAFDEKKHVIAPSQLPPSVAAMNCLLALGSDFGAVNEYFGIFGKGFNGDAWVLLNVIALPKGTTRQRAAIVQSQLGDRQVWGSWGGNGGGDIDSGSERQIRLDYTDLGIAIDQPPVSGVDAQFNCLNDLFDREKLFILNRCKEFIFQAENAYRDPNGKIVKKSQWHILDLARYFASGVNPGGAGDQLVIVETEHGLH
jgi:hypothetical protein